MEARRYPDRSGTAGDDDMRDDHGEYGTIPPPPAAPATDPFPPVLADPTAPDPLYSPTPDPVYGPGPGTVGTPAALIPPARDAGTEGAATAAKEAARETGSTAKEEAGATASTAASEAAEVAGTAAEGAKQVAGEATRQLREVAQEATDQARTLARQATDQARKQAQEQTSRLAENLRQMSRQARSLAEGNTQEAGQIGDYVQRFADRASDMAQRLESRGFEGVVEDVQRFARRRPMLFVGLAAAAGFAVSRVARSVADGQDQDGGAPWYDGDRQPLSAQAPSAELSPPLGVYGGVAEPLPPAVEMVDLTVEATPTEVGATSDPLGLDDRLERGAQEEVG
jgi:ElaB/YqjD/DUF883 family membrane-anchored ribosome-binding protein